MARTAHREYPSLARTLGSNTCVGSIPLPIALTDSGGTRGCDLTAAGCLGRHPRIDGRSPRPAVPAACVTRQFLSLSLNMNCNSRRRTKRTRRSHYRFIRIAWASGSHFAPGSPLAPERPSRTPRLRKSRESMFEQREARLRSDGLCLRPDWMSPEEPALHELRQYQIDGNNSGNRE